jgi:NADH:ubiquinone oxidoreductase subunit 6 (subunit J)
MNGVIESTVFGLLSVLILVPAVLAVGLKNIFHCALWLVVSLTGVGGMFALLGADFLFVAQILVYAGGITVLLLFVVLLSGSPKNWMVKQVNAQWGWGLALVGVFVGGLSVLFHQLPAAARARPFGPHHGFPGASLDPRLGVPFRSDFSGVYWRLWSGRFTFRKRINRHDRVGRLFAGIGDLVFDRHVRGIGPAKRARNFNRN